MALWGGEAKYLSDRSRICERILENVKHIYKHVHMHTQSAKKRGGEERENNFYIITYPMKNFHTIFHISYLLVNMFVSQ